jgi:hypothetical protein
MLHIAAFVDAYAASEIATAIRADIRSVAQPRCMHALASELVNEASPVSVRDAAGLTLENLLTARVCRAIPSFLKPPFVRSSLTFLLAPTGLHTSGKSLDPQACP